MDKFWFKNDREIQVYLKNDREISPFSLVSHIT